MHSCKESISRNDILGAGKLWLDSHLPPSHLLSIMIEPIFVNTFMHQVLQSSNDQSGSCFQFFWFSPHLNWGNHSWTHFIPCVAQEIEWTITDLYLLDLLLLMQPRTRFVFLAALPHRRLTFIFLSTTTRRGISAELYLSLFCHRRLFHSLCRTFHLSLLNLINFFQAQSLSPLICHHIMAHLSSISTSLRNLMISWGLIRGFNPDIQIVYKDFEKYWIQYWSFI